MHALAIPPSTDAPALLAAAERLEQAAADATSPRLVAASLVEVEATLRSLDRTCLVAASALIPRPDGDDGICARYAAAAQRWEDGEPPSYERQARILSCLHDSAATLRAAAECCRRARILLETTIHEASLDELAAAAATLEQVDPVDGDARGLADAAADARRRRGLANLRVALADAAGATQAARALAARVLTRIASE